MTFEEYIARLDLLEQTIRQDLQRVTVTAANDLASGIAFRVVNQKKNATGGDFSAYSTTPVYASSFKGKGRNGSSDTRISALGRGAKISYKDFRAINNLNSDKKDFNFTGDMWRNFGVLDFSENEGKVSVNIGGKTPSAIEKLAGHSKREGYDIAAASAQEELDVRADFENWLSQILPK